MQMMASSCHVQAAGGRRAIPPAAAARRRPLLPLLARQRRAAGHVARSTPAPDAAALAASTAGPNGASGAAQAAAAPAPADEPAPGAPAGAGTSSTVQVTRSNFRDALDAARAALRSCEFFAFDCEMTGLTLDGQEDKLLDDAFDRHERTVAAAQQFLILQFGLTAFVWRGPRADASGGGGGGGGGAYEARTFNFYLFPAPRGDFDLRFACQASSMAFLASQGFDFNKVR